VKGVWLQTRLAFGAILGLLMAAEPAVGWTPRTQLAISDHAASIAPPDLARQISKYKEKYRQGLLAPFRETATAHHTKNPDGSGSLDLSVEQAARESIDAIVSHRPFSEIVYSLGILAHYLADANNPLNSSNRDPREPSFFGDYLRYVESVQEKFPVVFYGEGREVDQPRQLRLLLDQSLERSRGFYPMIGLEYERIGEINGIQLFDDKSTAFGVGSVSFSHAVSDIAAALRYVWLRAGGGDRRDLDLTPPGANSITSEGSR
jgi:hypothetical protein